jgi:sec-independent protein translocase protein TatA
MPNIGPMELAIVAIIALLVLGPKRLPAAGRSLGQGLREFKESIAGRAAAAGDEGTGAGDAGLRADDAGIQPSDAAGDEKVLTPA